MSEHRDSLSVDHELAKLATMPREKSERHLGWRLIEAFVDRDACRLLFWSLVFAKFVDWDCDAEVSQEILRTITSEEPRRWN